MRQACATAAATTTKMTKTTTTTASSKHPERASAEGSPEDLDKFQTAGRVEDIYMDYTVGILKGYVRFCGLLLRNQRE